MLKVLVTESSASGQDSDVKGPWFRTGFRLGSCYRDPKVKGQLSEKHMFLFSDSACFNFVK